MVPYPTRISRLNRRVPAAWVAVIAIWSCAPVALGDARADYASLFGEEEKKVLATAFTKDDATFAAKLLARAGDLKDAPELQRLVLTRAVELGQKDADGLATAIDAAKQIITIVQGTEKLDWRGKLVDLYAAQYKRATGTKRAEAGEFLLNILQKEADDLTAESKYADAVKRLNEARDIARSIRSPRVDDFLSAAKDVQTRQQTAEKYDRLRQKLEQQGGDTAMLEQVILGYLLEVGDAETAKKLAAGHPDKTWDKMLAQNPREISKVPPAELLPIGDWYMRIAEQGGDTAVSIAAGGVAQSAYRLFLRQHDRKDAEGLRARTAHDKITSLLAQKSPGSVTADGVSVWNQHNGKWNDWGATNINIALKRAGKVVWRRNGIDLPWRAGMDDKVDVSLPPVPFDHLRVEVTRWRGNGGGLAEVQIWSANENIALKQKVVASDYLIPPASVPRDAHQPSNVVDGITSSSQHPVGYWLSAGARSCWVEIEVRAGSPASEGR